MSRMTLEVWQDQTGLRFRDQSLLYRALTHPSYLNENPSKAMEDNQRLEFLGDAVLAFVSGEWLFSRFHDASEGRLTRLRAALVRTETLAQFAQNCRLGESLLVGKGEAETGGRSRPANLCDAFEAVVGALYLDQGVDAVRSFVYPFFEAIIEPILSGDREKDAKSSLQEWSQRNLGLTPVYETTATEGPDHAKQFTVVVKIGGKTYSTGVGSRKQIAEQDAAMRTIELLQGNTMP